MDETRRQKMDTEGQSAYGVLDTGELMSFGEENGLLDRSSMKRGEWEEWYAGMDGFGGMTALAASLLQGKRETS